MAWVLEYLPAASAGRMPAMKEATEVLMTKIDQHSTILNRVAIGHRSRRSDRLALYLTNYCLDVGFKTKQKSEGEHLADGREGVLTCPQARPATVRRHVSPISTSPFRSHLAQAFSFSGLFGDSVVCL